MICGVNQRTHCKQPMKDLNILSLPSIYIYKTLIYIKENIYQFEKSTCTNTYFIRNNNNLKIKRVNYTRTQKSFVFLNEKNYNKIPNSLKNLQLNIFKRRMKKLLIENCLYKTEDFFTINFNNI